MAEEQPSLHIDTDWKKQAQQEKRRLAEQAAKNAPATPPAVAGGGAMAATGGAGAAGGTGAAAVAPAPRAAAGGGAASGSTRRGTRELPPPSFASLVQSMMSQVLFYLGELASASGQGMIDLDMAKHQLDTLSVLEDKTRNNLTDQEQALLDAALYETRSHFINVATQFLGP